MTEVGRAGMTEVGAGMTAAGAGMADPVGRQWGARASFSRPTR